MLRLNVSDVDLDLYQDEAVNLTIQFSDLESINSPVGSFSQTFRVPGTAKNMDVFGPINTSDPGSVNLKLKKVAELFSGSVSILRGFVQVKAVYLQKQHYADIELVFFAGAVDLKTAIGDAKLSDLNTTAKNHDLTYANVIASWSGLGIGPEVTYGLVDKGFNWSFPSNPPWSAADGLYLGELTPMFQAKYVLDRIMDDAGYTYDSTFLEETGNQSFERVYLPGLNGALTLVTDDIELSHARAGLTADFIGSTLTTLDLEDDATGGVDEGGNWNNTTNQYTAPYTGWYSANLTYSYDQGSHTEHVTIQVVKNGSTVLFEAANIANEAINNSTGFQDFVLVAGDTVEVKGRAHASGVEIIGNDSTVDGARTSLEIIGGNAFSGFQVRPADNMPDMKQIDFLIGLQKMFNLVFVPDKNRDKHLLIEPYVDYMDAGTEKSWNHLIDYDHDITIKPTTDLQAKRYEWTHKAGQDFLSQEIDRSLDRVYGRYEVTDGQNDFATGDKKIETPFAPYITSVIPGSQWPIHRNLQEDGSGVSNPLPTLAYYHNLNDLGSWYLRNDSGVEQELTTFPSFSNYSTVLPTLTSKDLNFGVESPLISSECTARDTLFIEYWSQYVTELYSEEARIMTLHVKLDRVELADLEFSDKIWMRGARWRVLKMTYDANVEGLVKVECIKVLSDLAFCEDIPTSILAKDNFILFNDSTAFDPDYGSRACCIAYGYNWQTFVENNQGFQRCIPQSQTNPPT